MVGTVNNFNYGDDDVMS